MSSRARCAALADTSPYIFSRTHGCRATGNTAARRSCRGAISRNQCMHCAEVSSSRTWLAADSETLATAITSRNHRSIARIKSHRRLT